MKVTISPFGIETYDEVFALWRQCDGIGLSDADSRDNIRAYLERNPGLSFIATVDGAVVGAILAGHDGRRGYIHHLAVHPKFRRRGIARQLVDRCLKLLTASDIGKCHIFIFNKNADGLAFWTSVGWLWREDISVMSKNIETVESDGR
ncbi:MAG: GNAT family N-acetyltransferase [Deltaproteobacteria bacterium]|nr:GNAT family N-acetyltransferase [Deltaproteobacteria bacterium]